MMLTLERHQEILKLIEREGSARVSDLAGRFEVTEETIRRDLQKLAATDQIRRSHGGAIFNDRSAQESPYWFREIANEAEKSRIAEEAIRRILPGERVILDASTTAWHMAKRLPNQPLTVITHSVQVIQALARTHSVDVIGLGGTLAHNSMSFVGPVAERQLQDYHVDKVFMSCRGIDFQTGLTDASVAQAQLRRLMLDQADHRTLLIDHSKFGVKALAHIAGIEAFDEMITDSSVDPEVLHELHKLSVNTTVV
jgi:DeoR/GlpR family transcriptional regulator of sugar metabolism